MSLGGLVPHDGPAPHPALQGIAEVLRRRPFAPHPLLRSAHLQTVLGSLLPREFPWGWAKSSERMLELDGGCQVRALLVDRAPDAPVLVALHGVGGSSESRYMQGLSHKAYREGWNAVLFNLYDRNLEGRRPTLFHAGSSPQIEQLLEGIREIRQWSRFYLAGISLGGNMLLRLLGNWGERAPHWIAGAAVVSPLVDLEIGWKIIEEPSNVIYRVHFLRRLKRLLRQRSGELRDLIDFDALEKVRTFREFDDHVTAPMGGYEDAFDYYRRASSAPLLGKIRVPTLVIHSRDDPILPLDPWMRPEGRSHPSLLAHLTEHGGHVGFIEHEKTDIDRAWAENRMIDFFRLLA